MGAVFAEEQVHPAERSLQETSDYTGGSSAHDNIQPSLVLNYYIAIDGVFPQQQGQGQADPSGPPMLGEVRLFAFNFAPGGWALCDGTILPIADYSALFSILGTTYGGNGRTTFALPDLRGRGVVGVGTGAGLTERRLGRSSGDETVTLTTNQLAAHAHSVASSSASTSATGAGQAHDNIQPWQGINYIVYDGDNDAFDGEVRMFAGYFAPDGYYLADGQSGRPDLRGRLPIGTGSGPGLTSRTLRESLGTETETLIISQLPAHDHTYNGGSNTTDQTGGGSTHNNMQPSLALNFFINTAGGYPCRHCSGMTSTRMIGEITIFANEINLASWVQAEGNSLNISGNGALFSLIGIVYGGDGIENFDLPDLRGRTAMGAGQGPGLSNRTLGDSLGVESVTLSETQLAGHAHELYPDLTVTKSNNAGNATNLGALGGGAWTWSATVDNTAGAADATFTTGQVIFSDQLPTTNISFGSVSVGSQTGITGTISCSISAGGLLTCSASGGSVTIAKLTGTFTASWVATPSAAGTYTNPTGGNCLVDPNTLITESDETNNGCTANSVVASAPDLTVTKNNDVSNATSLGDANDGAWTWSLTASNGGAGEAVFADGETILSDQLPTTNISYGTVAVGSVVNITNRGNILCTISVGGLLTCVANGADVTIGSTTGTFEASFTATPTTPASYINPTGGSCSIDPNGNVGETNEANNSCTSNTVAVSASDLTISKANNVSNATSLGDANDGAWTWSVAASNGGSGDATFLNGETIISDQLPTTNISYGTVSVGSEVNVTNSGNISCSISVGGHLTCVASGANVTLGGTTGTFTASFTATPSAGNTFTNPTGGTCSVDSGGKVNESNEGNNSCTANSVVVSAPDLQASKTNDMAGSVVLGGGNFTWTTTVTNTGGGTAVFGSGETIFVDAMPNSGISFGAVSVANQTNISGPGTISCTEVASTITCTAAGGTVTVGATTGSFDVRVTATPSIVGTFDNPRAGGICQVDSPGNVDESDEGNNTCSDSITVTAPDLTVTKNNNVSDASSLGDLNDGQWTWSIKVENVGNDTAIFPPGAGYSILFDNLPAGPTYGTPTVGSVTNVSNSGNISCSIHSNVLSCAPSGAEVTLGATTGSFTVSFTVTPASTGAHVNPSTTCEVDNGSDIPEGNEGNNSCTDTVTVSAPDLQVSKANNVSDATSLSDVNGGAWSWTLTMTNPGSGEAVFADGETILTDNLPNGPTWGTVTVNSGGATNVANAANISCSITTDVLTCSADGADVTFGGGTTASVSLSFTATPNSTGAHANPSTTCAIDPTSKVTESNEGNNTCSDTVAVSAPDLQVSKANNVSDATSLGDVN